MNSKCLYVCVCVCMQISLGLYIYTSSRKYMLRPMYVSKTYKQFSFDNFKLYAYNDKFGLKFHFNA